MKQRPFGNTGEAVCEMGLGTFHITKDMGVPRDEALRIVDRALSLGVNLIDTAPMYGNGESEARFLPCRGTRATDGSDGQHIQVGHGDAGDGEQ